MLIQIHMLQNYVPSLLNRDDTGAAKSAYFGGRQRGRISSQCLKRSIRRSESFRDAFAGDDLLAVRTQRLPALVDQALQNLDVDEETRKAIVIRVPEIGQESTKRAPKDADVDDLKTRQLIFMTPGEAEAIAAELLKIYEREGPKKWAKMKVGDITKPLGNSLPRSVDIAMFGRMTTSDAFEDVAAAVQVAHALSTNELVRVYDYFTAVDDLKKMDEDADAGAGMIGDVELNSSTYYKYINVHWDGLLENLGGDVAVARRAVVALLEAAAVAQPSGKQNSTAAHQLPDFVLVEVSDANLPVSYANAFLKPVTPGRDGATLMDNSIKELTAYAGRLRRAYGLNGSRAYFATQDLADDAGAENAGSLPALKTWVAERIGEATGG